MFGVFQKKQRVAAVIDIGSTSVGAAFVVFDERETPLMPYAVREEITFPDEKRSPLCMLRALETALNALESEGRPALSRARGLHHIDRVFVSLGSPWQDTQVETKVVGDGKPFVFSRDILARAVKERAVLPEGKKELQVEVLATLLNGYETRDPYGKKAERAEILLLSSSMDAETMGLLHRSLKRLHAREGVRISPLTSLAHTVLRAQYPHDKEFLLLLVSDEATNLMFAHHSIIMDATCVPVGMRHIAKEKQASMRTLKINEAPEVANVVNMPPSSETPVWTSVVHDALKGFASRHALPRMVFLVSSDGSAEVLKRLLDTSEMHTLWLSDEPLTVIPVISKLLSSLIQHQGTADADVMLDLITLFARLQMNSR